MEVGHSVKRSGRGKYCSKECYNKRNKGKGSTREMRKRLRGSKEGREWRESVFARDNWTCQDCGDRGGYLEAHHIFPFSEFPDHRMAVWNGVTLCAKCHRKCHRKRTNLQHVDFDK